MARAFAIGKFEAGAVWNLVQKVSPVVWELLRDAVRVRGMKPFLTHETISREIFNLAFSSGVGALEAWNGPLTNKEDNEIAAHLNRFRIAAVRLSCFVGLLPFHVC